MDFIAVYSQQRNQARLNYGQTSVHLPGRTDINYPNLTGYAAKQLIAYWRGEAERVRKKAMGNDMWFTQAIPQSAIRDQWLRAVAALQGGIFRLGGSIDTIISEAHRVGGDKLPEDQTVKLWNLLDSVVTPMRAIDETPSRWGLFEESVDETLNEYKNRITKSPFFIGAVVVGAVLLLKD